MRFEGLEVPILEHDGMIYGNQLSLLIYSNGASVSQIPKSLQQTDQQQTPFPTILPKIREFQPKIYDLVQCKEK